tara:strand:- start:249 stop:605 length:357 start_codon:yes stop_codon:yes gene_type:complete
MSHFAKIADGLVTNVIVAEQEFVDGQEGTWVQTSYNTIGGKHYDQDGNEDSITPLRKNYAGVGYTYDSDKDAFYSHKPYPSWTLNDTTCQWESPVPYPSDEKVYDWNEETTAWDLVEE